MSSNPYAEAIGLLFSGKDFKRVLVKIAQNNPGVLVKAFRECYPDPVPAPKFDAVITRAENDAKILAIAKSNLINGIKEHRAIYRSGLNEAKDAVKKMLAEDRVKP